MDPKPISPQTMWIWKIGFGLTFCEAEKMEKVRIIKTNLFRKATPHSINM